MIRTLYWWALRSGLASCHVGEIGVQNSGIKEAYSWNLETGMIVDRSGLANARRHARIFLFVPRTPSWSTSGLSASPTIIVFPSK